MPGELQVEIDGPAECCIEHVDVSLVPVGGVEELMTAAYRNIYEGITVDVVVHQ